MCGVCGFLYFYNIIVVVADVVGEAFKTSISHASQ